MVNFAFYSSNWTKMDIERKQLILCAMKVNNANKLSMKFTYFKCVNLELFTNVCIIKQFKLCNYNII